MFKNLGWFYAVILTRKIDLVLIFSVNSLVKKDFSYKNFYVEVSKNAVNKTPKTPNAFVLL